MAFIPTLLKKFIERLKSTFDFGTQPVEMSEEKEKKNQRLFKVAKELNVATETLASFLAAKGHKVNPSDPNEKISSEQYDLLVKEYAAQKKQKLKAEQLKTQQREAKPKERDEGRDKDMARPGGLFYTPPAVEALGEELVLDLGAPKSDAPLNLLFELPTLIPPSPPKSQAPLTPPSTHATEPLPAPKENDEKIPAYPPSGEIEVRAESAQTERYGPRIVGYIDLDAQKAASRALRKKLREQSETSKSDAPAPALPQADVPAPALPQADVPAPALPQADAPAPALPQADVPAPALPQADVPAPALPQADVPAPASPQADTPSVQELSKVAPPADDLTIDQRKEKIKLWDGIKDGADVQKAKEAQKAKNEGKSKLEKKSDDRTEGGKPTITGKSDKSPDRPSKEGRKPDDPQRREAEPRAEAIRKTTAENMVKETEAPPKETPSKTAEKPAEPEIPEEVIRAKDHAPKLEGLKIVGKIELPVKALGRKDAKESRESRESRESKDKDTGKKIERTGKPVFTTKALSTQPPSPPPPSTATDDKKRKRKRKPAAIPEQTQTPARTLKPAAGTPKPGSAKPAAGAPKFASKAKEKEAVGKQAQEKVRKTFAEMGKGAGRQRQLVRRDKRAKRAHERDQLSRDEAARESILEVTEYLTANELANLMDVPVNSVIGKCMELGLFVSINQRIEADVISLIAEEFGYQVKFLSVEESFAQEEEEADDPDSLEPRAPIVTVMGHVDHGKTSLLDYIRKTNVIAGEAGGITQHIGAYEVKLPDGRKITFLDTPGHEAFTAMRARGAQVTDLAVIVIAADDQVMPQTREAINHAQAAGVPMVFAINKIDKPGADPERIKQQLAEMNILVEDWGGKVQSQEISAKTGLNVDKLLEKVLIEAELLDLKANPHRMAKGTVIEAQLDKGRGVVATVLVQNGTLNVGDIVVANCHYGKVKALTDERGKRVKNAGPSQPVQILGLDGVPQAGDKFYVVESEREAREITSRRQQLMREQSLRMHKHITLEEIARRSSIGDFKELNIILKGDVDGSVEALADSLIRLSTDEVALRIVLKGVGQITESDVLLASASNAIIIGFQVRPAPNARKLAQQESIDIRLYSVIYEVIDEIKSALEGMLAPKIEEEVVGVAEVRELFKIQKVGTIAGCMIIEGKVARNNPIRIIRDGVVVFSGKIESLKRFKDDVKEVSEGFECGIGIENFNDLKIGDLIESFVQKEVKRTLA